MVVHPYVAIAFVALGVGATWGTKFFGSKIGGVITAVIVFGIFAGLRAVMLSFT